MDLIYYTVLTLAWAVGGFLSGITSMGCALIALPILNMVMSPEQAVLNSCVCAGVIAAVLVMRTIGAFFSGNSCFCWEQVCPVAFSACCFSNAFQQHG